MFMGGFRPFEYEYCSNKNGFFWTEWSDYDITDDAHTSCLKPNEIDMRQKENKLNWQLTGNILLSYEVPSYDDPIWRYGLKSFKIYCFDDIQRQVFTSLDVPCVQMEKRFCCEKENEDKFIRISRVRTHKTSERFNF